MRTKASLRLLLGVAALGLGTLWACASFDPIDGSKVPTLGSADAPPSCEDVCTRLAQLCGFAPTGCVDTCRSETDGWDDGHRACAGLAPSCRDALSCENAEAADGGDEAGEDASGNEDAGEDAGGEEEPSDASTDAPDGD